MKCIGIKAFIKGQVGSLFLASLLGIVMGFLASILNTRYLNPEQYGDYRYVFNIISFISSISLLGYFVSGSRLLAITNSLEIRRKINGAMIIILLIVTGISALLMLPLYILHKYWINPTVASLFLWSIPVVGAPLFLNYINTTFQGENKIRELSLARVLPYLVYLPLGYLIYSNFGSNPIILMLLQNGCAILIYITLIVGLKPQFKNISSEFAKIKEENKSYGIHVYLGSVLAVSFGYLSGITLGLFEDNNVNVGFYTLALTMSTPLTMLPSIVGTTHFREFASLNKIPSAVIKETTILSILSFVAFLIVVEPLVKWVYDDNYSIVGYYSCFLAIGMTFHGFGDMFNRFLGAHGHGKEIRNSAIVTGIIQVLGSFVFVYYWGIYGALATRILSSLIYFIIMVLYYNKIIKRNRNNVKNDNIL